MASPTDSASLSRAGLLHLPSSYADSFVRPHSQGEIRDGTMQLSSISFSDDSSPMPTPRPSYLTLPRRDCEHPQPTPVPVPVPPPDESTPLVPPPTLPTHTHTRILPTPRKHFIPTIVLKSIPAVLLGCLLNILDGVSYGMIMFPATGVFAGLGPMGVSMFFLSTVLAQLVYTFGGSKFAGANGSMMIEVVPFFHILANSIRSQIGEEHPSQVIATTLAAYTLSSILTGLTFFLLGALRLGALIGFFPRHILVGCIGGVGAFLFRTGFAVSMRVDEDVDWGTFERMFMDKSNLVLWAVPLVLAVLLRVITSRCSHQLVMPIYFLIIPIVFYIIVAVLGANLSDLRKAGWIFDMGTRQSEAWYKFYSHWDFAAIRYKVLLDTLPTQFALLFFNILHPPLNVPALSVSLDEDVNTDKELVAHGYSNLLSALFGTVPNYLVYVNTLLFYRVGGGTRIAGFMLAVMTAVLLVIGTAPIAYIPVTVVGALIFVLGIDLVKEALWDTRHRTTRTEYVTIVGIVVVMTVWDFVTGVLCGIIASCFFFVVQNSQRRSIRSLHSGETAMSTVRRPSVQRAYLREVSKQTTIVKLQGFLFFGTISHVEDTIRDIIDGPEWHRNPVTFLVLDLTLVAGVDMSSTEAFVRIRRFLAAKQVRIVFCGFAVGSAVARALESVHVIGAEGVEHFGTLSDAMEWTENVYLRAWYVAQKHEAASVAFAFPGRHNRGYDRIEPPSDPYVMTPRRSYMRDVGNRTMVNERIGEAEEYANEPLNTLVRAFASHGEGGGGGGDLEFDVEMFEGMSRYLERVTVPEEYVLWEQGDAPDGMYFVQSGVLRASYRFAEGMHRVVEESMVPGTLAGELSALSGLPRNASVVVERAAVLWRMSAQSLERLEREEPLLARVFVRFVLKAAKIDYDILISALASGH